MEVWKMVFLFTGNFQVRGNFQGRNSSNLIIQARHFFSAGLSTTLKPRTESAAIKTSWKMSSPTSEMKNYSQADPWFKHTFLMLYESD